MVFLFNGIFGCADLYQITMAYAYWKAGKKDSIAVFDLFFRKNPFDGEYTIFAGLEEVLRYIACFRFSKEGKLLSFFGRFSVRLID